MEKEKIRNVKWMFIIFFVAFIFIVVAFFAEMLLKNINNSNNNSLDKDGYEIIYKVENKNGSKVSKNDLLEAKGFLSKMVDRNIITQSGESVLYDVSIDKNNICVKIKSDEDINNIRKQLSIKTHYLTFRNADDSILMDSSVLNFGGARVSQDSSGNPAVSLSIKDKDKFYEVTSNLSKEINNILAIWLDFDDENDSYKKELNKCGSSGSHCLSAATVSQGFASDVIIQGNFTFEEIADLVEYINLGTLSVKIKEISCKKIHYVDNSASKL